MVVGMELTWWLAFFFFFKGDRLVVGMSLEQ